MTPALAEMANIERKCNSRDGEDNLLNKGFLWAVQTNRRSLERRLWRRIMHPFYQVKLRHDLKACTDCGSLHEGHTVCGVCYEKVKMESKEIQDLMVEHWQWTPVDKDTVVKYQGETVTEEERKCKQIVELPRPRPKFFSDNLTQKTNGIPDH